MSRTENILETMILQNLDPPATLGEPIHDFQPASAPLPCDAYPIHVGDRYTPQDVQKRVFIEINRRIRADPFLLPPGTILSRVTLPTRAPDTLALVNVDLVAILVPITRGGSNAARQLNFKFAMRVVYGVLCFAFVYLLYILLM